MAKLGSITYDGISGKEYSFDIYALPGEWNSVTGFYLITKRVRDNINGGHTHTLLYVGETDDLKVRMSNHHKQNCFGKNNANCLCWLDESNENRRLSIESDICEKWNPKCND